MKPTLCDRVVAKCVPCGDCMIWKGAMGVEAQTPVIYYKGRTRSVRAALWLDMGRYIPPDRAIRANCGEPFCVAPEHLEMYRYKKYPKSAIARAAVTKARQTASKLTWDDIAEIRASDEPTRKTAERMGVSQRTVFDIRAFKRWLPRANPFTALMK